jgi:hypothetical protein
MKLLKIESNNHLKNLIKITITTLLIFIFNGVMICLVLFLFRNTIDNETFNQSIPTKFEFSEFFYSIFLFVFIIAIYEEFVFRFNLISSTLFSIILRLLWGLINVIFFHIILRFNDAMPYSILFFIITLTLSSLFILPNILKKYVTNIQLKKLTQYILNLFFIILHPIFLTFTLDSKVKITDNNLLITLTFLSSISLIINSLWYTYLRNTSENNKTTFWYSVYAHGLFNFFILLVGTINL